MTDVAEVRDRRRIALLLLGGRRVFLFALVLFASASLFGGLATSSWDTPARGPGGAEPAAGIEPAPS